MFYNFCYMHSAALHNLNHTDARALVVCCNAWLWHCGSIWTHFPYPLKIRQMSEL